MSVQHYYHMCNRGKGRAVEIVTKDGKVHRGVIQHVDRQHVYLQPLRGRSLGGYGYGFGLGGLGIGIALGAIGTLAFLGPRFGYGWGYW